MDYNELAKQRNEQNHFARYIGIVTTKIEKGYAEAVLTVKPEHMNAMNIVHGGCIYTLADVATGSAAASLCSQAVTTSGEYHYLYSHLYQYCTYISYNSIHIQKSILILNTKQLKAYSKCIKNGKNVLLFDVEIKSDDDNIIGKGTFTCYRLQ